jgi:hypothetical protein
MDSNSLVYATEGLLFAIKTKSYILEASDCTLSKIIYNVYKL